MRSVVGGMLLVVLTGCMAPTTPMAEYASENAISIRYSAYDTVPTLTAEAQDMAVKHCAKYGKFANYRGGNAANALTTEEIHRFACERRKTDDGSVIAGQSRRPGYVIIN